MQVKYFLLLLVFSLLFANNLQSASDTKKEFKGTATQKHLNEGAEFQIHWYVDKEKNIDVTSFTDTTNECVIIIEGKHTTEFPVVKGGDQVLVYCEKATITLDKNNKIVNVQNDGIMDFGIIETE